MTDFGTFQEQVLELKIAVAVLAQTFWVGFPFCRNTARRLDWRALQRETRLRGELLALRRELGNASKRG